MPLPASVPTITVTGTFYKQTGLSAGAPAAGTITFTSPQLRVAADDTILPKQSFTATLDAAGSFSVVLLVTDSTYYTSPSSWAYSVSVSLTDATFTSNDYQFPSSYGVTVDLADVSPVTDPADCDVTTCVTQEDIAGLQQEIVVIEGDIAALEAADVDLQNQIDTITGAGIVTDITAGTGLTGGGTGAVNLAVNVGTADTSIATYGQLVAGLMLLTSGEELIPRRLVNAEESMNAGTLHLTYTIARKTETINSLFTVSGNGSTGATLAQIGIYAIDPGTLAGTLIAFTPATATMWAGSFTPYTPGLNVPWNKVAGTLYAAGFLFTGATPPQVECCNVRYGSAAFAPRIQGQLGGQVAMPASFTNGSLSESFQNFQVIGLP